MSIPHLHRVEPREMDLRVRPPPHFVIPTPSHSTSQGGRSQECGAWSRVQRRPQVPRERNFPLGTQALAGTAYEWGLVRPL